MGPLTRSTMPAPDLCIAPAPICFPQYPPQSSSKAVHVSYFAAFPHHKLALRGAL